ncbi:MAG: beta-carotene hydroxylase [Bacteroidota bacterium]
MYILINVLIILGTFLFMEGVAWFTHKYIMHGFLWVWHKSHHSVHGHVLELNDLFALVFSVPSFLLIYLTTNEGGYSYLTSVGFGILGYGLFYFIFHDIIVHRRVKIKFKANSTYLKRIINAHYVHHEKHSKKGGEAFGFLYAPKKYQR